MDLCHRFFDDWGLRTVKRTDDEVVFETRQGPGIILKKFRHTQVFMFPSPQPGSTLSEVVWGVASRQDLDLVAEELARDRPVQRASKTDRCTASIRSATASASPYGSTPALAPTHNIDPGATRTNFVGSRTRINEPAIHYARAEPTRIGHVVFEISGVGRPAQGRGVLSRAPEVLGVGPLYGFRPVLPLLRRRAIITTSRC